MKYSEEEYKKAVADKYGSEIKIMSKYIGIKKPILIEDNYGVLRIEHAGYILKYKPGISLAVNKTDYAMNMLKEKHFHIYSKVKPIEEYKSMKSLLLFKTEFGIVKTSFDSLMSGHMPNIRSAIDRKSYFKQQLLLLYDNKYDFKISTTNRHGGKSILVCPIHGEVVIDNDYIFSGKGCPKCRGVKPSTSFYLIKLSTTDFSCYKIGISYRENGVMRRYRDYKKIGYNVEVLQELDFDDNLELKLFELKIKRLIKDYLVTPIN